MASTQVQRSESGVSTPTTAAAPRGGASRGGRQSLRGVGYAAGAAALKPSGESPIVAELKGEFGGLLGLDLSGVSVVLGSGAGGAQGVAQHGQVHLSVTEEALREPEGRWLLAHEFVHIAQGRKGGGGSEEADCEVEAEELASRLVAGAAVQAKASNDPATPLHHKTRGGSWNLLSWRQKQSAIRYNRRRGLKKWKIRKFQNIVGVKDDGAFGPITVAGIARWQSKHGLGADGKIGPMTHRALQQHLGPQPGGPAPVGPKDEEEPKIKNGMLSANLSLSEFASKDGASTPKSVVNQLKKLAAQLEVIRQASGGRSLLITSGYRSPAHNAAVGGASKSQHLYGRAVDFNLAGMSAKNTHKLVSKLINQGKIPDGGLGRYSSFTHYDIRGSRARW